MKKFLAMVGVLGMICLLAGNSLATPDRAEKTGKSCGECHSHVGKRPLGQ